MEWTIGELAEQASAALASTAWRGGRGRDVPNERVIRWYSTIGLLDPPSARRGRVAVYGRRHLLQLVAVKRRQADGRTIAEIQAELAGATDRTLETIARLPEPAPDHRPGHRAEPRPESGPEQTPGRGGLAAEAPSPATARPRFWTGAPASAPSPPPPEQITRPAPPTASGVPPASVRRVPGPAGRITDPDGPTEPTEPTGRIGRIGPSGQTRPTGPSGIDEPDGSDGSNGSAVAARPPARSGGFVPPPPSPAVPSAVTVHGVRLADGVTLLLDGGPGGRGPSPDELAEIAAASRELLSLLRERGLTPPEGLHP